MFCMTFKVKITAHLTYQDLLKLETTEKTI